MLGRGRVRAWTTGKVVVAGLATASLVLALTSGSALAASGNDDSICGEVAMDPVINPTNYLSIVNVNLHGAPPQRISQQELCGVIDIENTAYGMWAQSHGFADGDPRIVQYGQNDIIGIVFQLLNQIAEDENNGDAGNFTADQVGAYQWMQSIVSAYQVTAATDAISEYNRWLSDPCSYEPPNTTLFTFSGPNDPACSGTLASLLSGPTPPTYAEFLEFGLYDANQAASTPALTGTLADQLLERQEISSSNAAWAAISLAPGSALLQGAIPNLTKTLTKTVFPNRNRSVRSRAQRQAKQKQDVQDQEEDAEVEEAEEVDADEPVDATVEAVAEEGSESIAEGGVDVGEVVGDAVAGATSAIGIAFFMFGIAATLITIEVQTLVSQDKIPSQLQSNLTAQEQTPDVGAMMADPDQAGLVNALLYDQIIDVATPASGASTPPFDGSEFEVDYADSSGRSIYEEYSKNVQLETWPVGLTAQEFGTTPFENFAYSGGVVFGTPNPDQESAGLTGWIPTGSLNYFDWSGHERTAIVDGDRFIDVTGGGSADLGGQDIGDYCQIAADECGVKSTIEALGPGGIDLRITLAPDTGAPAVVSVTNQNGEIAGTGTDGAPDGLITGQTVNLTDSQTNPSGLPATYTWQIQTRCAYDPTHPVESDQGVPECPGSPDYGSATLPPNESDLSQDGVEDAAFHGAPVATEVGQSVSFTWPGPGTYHVRLITSDAYGATHQADENISVVDAPFSVPLSLGPVANNAVIGPVQAGTPVTVSGCIQSANGPYADPTASLTWGDGASDSQSAESGSSSPIVFTFHGACTASAWGFTATHTYSAASASQLPITLTVTDGFTQTSTTNLYASVTVAQTKPVFTSGATTTFTAGTPGNFSVQASGTPTPLISEAGALPPGVGYSAGVLSGTPPITFAGGTFPLTFTATNSVGSTTQHFTLVMNSAPRITSPSTVQVGVGSPVSFTPSVSGYPSPSLMDIDGTLPAGLNIEHIIGSATIVGTPAPGSAGTYDLTVTVTSASGTTTQQLALVVAATPTITSLPVAHFVTGTPNSFTVTTGGYPTPSISVDGALPTGLEYLDNGDGTATIFGSVSQTGTFPVTVTATSSAGTLSQSLTIEASSTGGPPITSGATAEFEAGTAGSFLVTSSDPTAAFSVEGTMPTGLSFHDNGNGSATLSGTAGADTTGEYGLAVTATDGTASSVEYLLVIVFGPPVFTSPSTAHFVAGVAGSFTVTAPANPVATVEAIGQSLPTGLSFTDNFDGTATISGTPAATDLGQHQLTVTATSVHGSVQQALTIEVDQAPVITSAPAGYFASGSADSFTVSTTGYPVPALSLVGSLGQKLTFHDNGDGTATIAGTPTGTLGTTHAVVIEATSPSGTVSQPFVVNIAPAPTVSSLPEATFRVGVHGSFTITTRATLTPSITAADALPAGLSLVDNGDGTATLAGMPATGTGGTRTVLLTVSNPYGVTQQSLVLTVQDAPAYTGATTITFDATANPLEGDGWTLTTTGTPVAAISLTGALPPGVLFTDNGDGTATVAGAAVPGSSGSYPLSVTVSNAVGTSTTSVLLVVDQTPTITSAAEAVFVPGSANSFTVTTTGSPTAHLTMLGAVPSWLTLTDNGDGTATLVGTPPADAAGQTFIVAVFAQNGVPNGDIAPIDVMVPDLAFTADTPPPATVGTPYSYQFATTVGSGPSTFSLADGVTLPAGLTMSDSGLLSGTPTTVGTTHIRVTAQDEASSIDSPSVPLPVVAATHELEISEFRLVGPGGSQDWYVDVTNTTSVAVPLAGWSLRLLPPTSATALTVPLGAGVVPAGGSLLIAGPFFSAATTVTPQLTGPTQADPSGGVAIVAPDSTVTDAAGMAGSPAALHRGAGLALPTTLASTSAYVRIPAAGGGLQNTDDNSADFRYGPALPIASTTAPTTLSQRAPTSVQLPSATGFVGQLVVTRTRGAVLYTEAPSSASSVVQVSGSGAVTVTASATPGSYTVTGTVQDTNGDTGVWTFHVNVLRPGKAPALAIVAVSPDTGPLAGGQAITISGTGFAAGAQVQLIRGTDLSTAIPAIEVSVVSSTQITAVTPSVGTAGTYHVVVMVGGMQSLPVVRTIYRYRN